LLWNERGLIVITDVVRPDDDLSSYLVPRPGVRLNLADLTESPLPPWTIIVDINNRGDLIGFGGPERGLVESVFLLRRGGFPGHDRVAGLARGAAHLLAKARERHGAALERFVHDHLNGGRRMGESAQRKLFLAD
jgi:hypothetical protein